MIAKLAKGKGGRPPKSDEGALTRTLAFRLRPSLREKLQHAATSEGRSVSEEVEARLTRSFSDEELQRQRFGDENVAYLSNLFASCLNVIQAKTGRRVWDDAETLEAAKDALEAILDASTDMLKDVKSVSAMQHRFDRDAMRFTWRQLVDMAEHASAEPDKPSLSEIIGR